MPQESSNSESNHSTLFSPNKNLRGLKGLVYNSNNSNDDAVYAEEIISDRELAQRKAGEAAARRYEASAWLRKMDQGASEVLPKEPTEAEFCLALRNGLILCNVLNKVNPGAVHKVVETRVIDEEFTEGAAQSAIQYFENTRNFLVAVGDMKLLTFEASDLEKGGSSGKVVDCILCLKGYYEWKQAGGVGVWRYGGTVRIVSFPKGSSPPSSFGCSELTDDSVDESESSQYEQLLEYLNLSNEVSLEESNAANALTLLFDRVGLSLLQAYLTELAAADELPLNSMVIDFLMRKLVKDFSSLLVSQSNQLGLVLKNILSSDCIPQSKSELIEIIIRYLVQRSNVASRDLSKSCICGGKLEGFPQRNVSSIGDVEALDAQQRELEELKVFSTKTKQEFQQFREGCEAEFKRLEYYIKGLEVAASSYHKVVEENRALYNQVQDLKGTIRVYCRVRPFLPGQSDERSTVDYVGENGDIMIANPYKQGKDARRIFTFNKVFNTNASQGQIYMDTQPLVRSVLDGYNVCIFAYGQTGSGKTYTMSGPDLITEETWGVNYRALRDLFQISKERTEMIEYEVGVQMIEIYNEQVRDLLVIDGTNRRLDIRNNSQLNGLNVPDASLVPVKCTQDVLDLMKIGQKNRAVGATALNERSSRSHSILTVHVRGKDLVSGSTLKGCLHLVDLAGSERVDKSEAVGERLKEAQNINRSLSALGDVISALAQKSTHIPYRNSKLTQVLQDSLGGHAKTLMFVHINPAVNALGETISTLKFAERVASINLGAARSNKESKEIIEFKDEISNLKLALEKKDSELLQLKSSGANTRNAVSPFRFPKSNNNNASLKTETNQRTTDEVQISEVRSCSSGKQRRSRLPAKFSDNKDTMPKIPFLNEERGPYKARSPSPPVRRSISTDRGALARSRIKPETTLDNNPPAMTRMPFPAARIPTNKSMAAIPSSAAVTSTDNNNTRASQASSQEPLKMNNISETLYSLQRITSRKDHHQEHDEEQFKQALNVRQGGIRKTKAESKVVKTKNQQQMMAKSTNKSDIGMTLLREMDKSEKTTEEAQKNDFSQAENEHVVSPVYGYAATRLKKFQSNFSRNSQNVEPRELARATESTFMGRQESKASNVTFHNVKEASNSSSSSSFAELRRSRSTPRGKFMIFP
ncbi:OLC1v1022401C1 [Oldenlandia corymbosa var. corymbosa]|uniref:OLC1v1022401C1 n=2 Tax=Oldenlandia corymbosa var. corymbosa TaxID=529605 RepID=A0AAV1C0E0_OLDCO|nr:OLC1v1022401C1 [Oldenlandia corymbosa var. corymbosa]